MDELFCNLCLEQFKPGDQAAALPCTHLYCRKCSEAHLTSAPLACPNCQAELSSSDVHCVRVLTGDEDPHTMWSLVGKSSKTAFEVVHTSIQFAVRQAEMYATAREQQSSEAKLAQMKEACKSKINQVHQGYKKAKRKLEEAVAHGQGLEAENSELRAKYNSKATEAQALREKLPRLQQENDELRQTCMQLARQAGVHPNQIPLLRGGGGGGGGTSHGGGALSGGAGSLDFSPTLGAPGRGPFVPGMTSPQAIRGALGAPGLRLSGPMPHSMPPPAPSPFISPGISHGGGMDFYTPSNAPVQRPAVIHSGPISGSLGVLRGSGGGGSGGGGGGGSGGMGPPESRVMHGQGGGRRDSLIPTSAAGRRGGHNMNGASGTPHALGFNALGGGSGSRRPAY